MNYKNVIKLLKRQRNSKTSEELEEAVEYAAYSFLVKTCKVLKRERRELSGEDMVNAFVAGIEWQKEQKPAEGKEYSSPECGTTAGVWSEEQDYSGLSDLERAIHRGFLCGGAENVPVAIIKETAKEVQSILKADE